MGIWPSIHDEILDLIESHRSTLVFTNSRGLAERLSKRLNELWLERKEAEIEAGELPEELVRAHHGSVSHEKRHEMEEGLKAGTLKAIVATSSLELGIDMGALDLVIMVESPGAVSRGLQRIGRAGHSVGERSQGVLCSPSSAAICSRAPRWRRAWLPESSSRSRYRTTPSMCWRNSSSPCRSIASARSTRCCASCDAPTPTATSVLTRWRLCSTCFPGRYPSDDFADLRPRLVWDRGRDLIEARSGSGLVVRTNAGTIPDRGLYSVHVGEGGPRVGELDEEMVHESRKGDVFYLGASTWRVTDITRDRVLVEPAPGEPGRMPFWRGEGPGRPIELGRTLGALSRKLTGLSEEAAAEWLSEETPLEGHAVTNLLSYLEEQKEHTGTLPTDKAITIERFRDELGDWRICILTPFGARVHAPWAMALEHLLTRRYGYEVQTMYTDDGIVLRLADADVLPETSELLPEPEDVEDLVVEQVGQTALFGSLFRENAARALLLPRRRPGQRTALWQQRLRAKNLLAVVRRFPDFPIVLETYRQCLRDVFDLPALIELLQAIRSREVRIDDVETPSASPFARSLVYSWVGTYLYEQDAPLAERRAQALSLDRNLLRELLGQAELRELLDLEVVEQVEQELQGLSYERRVRNADQLHDLLRRVGDLSLAEILDRSGFESEKESGAVSEEPTDGEASAADNSERDREAVPAVEAWLEHLFDQRRAVEIRLCGERRFIAAEDAARYRDALGVQPPPGLPEALLEPVPEPLESLLRRYARSHGPFLTKAVAERFDLLPAQVEPILAALERENRLFSGEIRPGGVGQEWCDPEVLRRIKRRTLARLRNEVAPVEGEVLARFLPSWQGLLDSHAEQASDASSGDRTGPPRRRRPGSVLLEEAITQLEGLALPWSSLSRAVLPARVPEFESGMLDLLAATGQVVWVGAGALGPNDGRVALYRRERILELVEERDPRSVLAEHFGVEETEQIEQTEKKTEKTETPNEVAAEGKNGSGQSDGAEGEQASSVAVEHQLHLDIIEHLEQRGASFTFELERSVLGESRGGRTAAMDFEAALWDLVWLGLVTNDTFLPLQNLASRRRTKKEATSLKPASPGSASLRRRSRGSWRGRGASGRTGRGGANAAGLAGGRWSLVNDLLDPEVSPTERAHARAVMLLERYGVVARETVLAEDVAGGFAGLYPVLQEMEDTGRVRRGWFLEGLGGRQFALPGAVDRLRAERDRAFGAEEHIVVLAAVDPANPWGASLPWPERQRDEGPRPRRVAHAWLLLEGGRPLLFIDAGGRSWVTFAAWREMAESGQLGRGVGALVDLARQQRRRSFLVERIDGLPAGESEYAEALCQQGFDRDHRGLLWTLREGSSSSGLNRRTRRVDRTAR